MGNKYRGGRVTLAIHRCRKPTIAAVNGSAVGIGATMQLPCAIRIAYAQAKIGFVFARRGLVMEAASSFFLPRLIGYSRALHLTTTGATYRADSKLLDGLYSEVMDTPEAVMTRCVLELWWKCLGDADRTTEHLRLRRRWLPRRASSVRT